MQSYTSSFFLILAVLIASTTMYSQDFQGQATYFSKSKLELGSWGARMSEAQKKQVQARLKNRLEKTYVLSFNREESHFDEKDKLDAISGATDSWGSNFSPGEQYKNISEGSLVQSQEFYGKLFLVRDKLPTIDWKMGKETKKIGDYLCIKATAQIPTDQLTWYDFSWGQLRNENDESDEESSEVQTDMTEVEAWYTPQIPVGHGPGEYWGLPGLILEVSAGNTIMLCSKIVMNPRERLEIEAPEKGKEITKMEYKETITNKMKEMRDNRGRRRSR
ncbi:GLPGLI family protein [Muriicola jejuensis]|uniref:GLPGLI family protein n=1 Tax=Muriicola jejuensis TaxID=504488 RepID=A0A6P0UHX8_9FLAO|nr:GLPGLI family protein [Muriicola jejuensis]NER11438.1 GLPGLI family protein [Muriicola jejuensis]SMP20780.1 GLPGLI family protein [Muriicola jejuensis]